MKLRLHILSCLGLLASFQIGASGKNVEPIDDIILEQPILGETTLDKTETISVDFPNEELIIILRNVSDLYQLNLVVPKELSDSEKMTSVKLRNVTWKQLFDAILAPSGYYWYLENNTVFIDSYENFSNRFTDESIRLQKIKFTDVELIIEALKDDNLVRDVHYNSETRMLKFKTRISLSFALTHIIERMDQEAIQAVKKKESLTLRNEQ